MNHENSTIITSTTDVNSKYHNKATNCTDSQKRHLFGGDCAPDVTSSVPAVHQGSSRALGPHEPYINDVNPILPITAMDSVPWINDYQPIERIQDDDEDRDYYNDYDDYDDRRSKIGNHIIDKTKSYRRSIRKHFVYSKVGKKANKRQKLSDITRRKLVKSKRNAASDSKLATVQISPVRMQKFVTNKLKRMLLHRLKLFDLSAMERRRNKESLTN